MSISINRGYFDTDFFPSSYFTVPYFTIFQSLSPPYADRVYFSLDLKTKGQHFLSLQRSLDKELYTKTELHFVVER